MTERTTTGSRPDRVSAEASEPAGQPVLLPRRRPNHLGPVHITQLLLTEAAVVAVLVTFAQGVVVAVGAVVCAVLLLLLTLGRSNGRWWLERRAMTRQYRRRRRATSSGSDPGLAALGQLAPGLSIENVRTANRTQVGVASDDAGWYGVLAVIPKTPMGELTHSIPLDLLAATLADANQPGATLQMVTHTVPAPSLDAGSASPVGQSYQQLLTGFGAVPVPADRATWIAIRLDARALAEGVTDISDMDAVPVLVAALLRRFAKSLRRVGIRSRLLDAQELLDALLRSCDLEAAGSGAQPTQPREEWSAWHSPRLAHRCFWIRGWPPIGQVASLLDRLSAAPAAMTSVALTLTAEDRTELLDLRALVRIAAPANGLDQICEAITRGAGQAGADLFPLDGEQGPAVYATAPTGGGPR